MRRDFDSFNSTGEKTRRLLLLEDALLSIPPTSVEPERSFSAGASICQKTNCRLNDDSFNDLCYGKAHLLSQAQK